MLTIFYDEYTPPSFVDTFFGQYEVTNVTPETNRVKSDEWKSLAKYLRNIYEWPIKLRTQIICMSTPDTEHIYISVHMLF